MHWNALGMHQIQWNSIRIQPNSPNSLFYMGFVSLADARYQCVAVSGKLIPCLGATIGNYWQIVLQFQDPS